jgi:hypothetical protein
MDWSSFIRRRQTLIEIIVVSAIVFAVPAALWVYLAAGQAYISPGVWAFVIALDLAAVALYQGRAWRKRVNEILAVMQETLAKSNQSKQAELNDLREIERGIEAAILADDMNPELQELRRYVKSKLIPEDVHKQYIFRKKGEMWEIAYRDRKDFILRDIKGLNYIAYLLRHPHQELTVLELVAAVEGAQGDGTTPPPATISEQALSEENLSVSESDHYEILDERAKAEYVKRLQELAEEREQATMLGDDETLCKIDQETKIIGETLKAGLGLRGASRAFVTPSEKARTKVSHQISDALDKIKNHDPALYEYLKSTIRTGTRCMYGPPLDTTIQWST